MRQSFVVPVEGLGEFVQLDVFGCAGGVAFAAADFGPPDQVNTEVDILQAVGATWVPANRGLYTRPIKALHDQRSQHERYHSAQG